MIQESIMSKKLNIILPGLGDSGGIRVMKKYQELLSGLGWDVIIYCPVKSYNLHRYKSSLKNLIHQVYCTLKVIFEINRKENIKWIWKVSDKSIRDADVTMATMWATAYDVNKLNKCKGNKYYFIQGFEIWDNRELGLASYKLPLNKIVISTWINNKLMETLGIGPFPIVMNGINTNKFYNPYKVYKTNNETVQLLMLNHTLEKKGVKYGIQSFEKVHEIFPNTKLKMFGMCPDENLPEYVEYYQNPVPELLIKLYCEADIFIFPSLEEGWGLAPLEAMACKCAVAGTNTGFVLDIGSDRCNMLISDAGDVDGMASNICQLISDYGLLKNISEMGYITVRQLEWKKAALELDKLLKKER